MSVGQKIRDRRKELGMTQKQLGELCGMADSAIRKYESGKIVPKHQTIKKIALALQTSEWNLLGVSFEDHEDGSSVAVVEADGLEKVTAHRLTNQRRMDGVRLGIQLETPEEKQALVYVLENKDTSPEWAKRLFAAFNKMTFPTQQILIRIAEQMVDEDNIFISELENISASAETDNKE